MNNDLTTFLNKVKGTIISDFEKVCQTQKSLEATMRTCHKIFDEVQAYIEANYIKK